MEPSVNADLGRLTWRCRRGMKELDLLLTGYLRDCWPRATPAERAAFERILELPDPLLAAYLTKRETPADTTLDGLLAVLRGRGAQSQSAAAAPALPSGRQRP
jgi:antitoxin CptB